jgi:deazaflavin-dependent oxidoreductase (nitroreductase family)
MQTIANVPSHKHPRKHLEGVRKFNRAIFNRFTLTFAGKHVFAIVEHRGRRTSRLYRTPVVAVPVQDGFVIPLTYGIDTDWYLNIREAGSCTLMLGGQHYQVHGPRVLTPVEALPHFKPFVRWLLKVNHVARYLHLYAEAVTE